MPHENVFDRYFERNARKGWQTLTLKGPLDPGFRTKRVAKISGSMLVFTIGETELGRASGLDREIASAIRDEGFHIEDQPSTSGSLVRPKTYIGFNIGTCTSAQLESVLDRIVTAIGRVAQQPPSRDHGPAMVSHSENSAWHLAPGALPSLFADKLPTPSPDLQQFETALRAMSADHPSARPFVCNGSPISCAVFLVGANAATDMREPFWPYWSTEQGFDKARWFEAYKRDRAEKPLKPGKSRRNAVSNTRKRLDWIAEEAAPFQCLETNVFSVPSEELRDLPGDKRGTEVFDFLLRAIRPEVLVVHGQDAEKHAEEHLGIELTPGEWTAAVAHGRSVAVIAVPHFSRGWSEDRARELGREIRRVCHGKRP